VVEKIPGTFVSESRMMALLGRKFGTGRFEVELEDDVYYLRIPRRLTDVRIPSLPAFPSPPIGELNG